MSTYGLYGKRKTTRIGKPQTPAQKAASQENYALFQLMGARGNLTAVHRTLKDRPFAYLISEAVFKCGNAIDSIKATQKIRKQEKTK